MLFAELPLVEFSRPLERQRLVILSLVSSCLDYCLVGVCGFGEVPRRRLLQPQLSVSPEPPSEEVLVLVRLPEFESRSAVLFLLGIHVRR